MNVKCAAESVFDRSLGWSGETSNFSECVELHVCLLRMCAYRNACLCRLMMVGESEETGNYPRLQLIHILSSVLAQGSRVIWECDRHTRTHTHIYVHTLTKWEHMMHAGQIYGAGLWAPYISPWLLQPEPGWVQAVYSGWAGYLMPRRLFSLPFPLQPSGSHGSSFLTEND